MDFDNPPPSAEAVLESRKLRAAEMSLLLRRHANATRTKAAERAAGPAWAGWLYDAGLMEEAAAFIEKHYVGTAP